MKANLSRREFLGRAAVCGVAATVSLPLLARGAAGGAARKFKLSLSPGSIGVKIAPREIIALAHKHGFEAIEANTAFLTSLSETELSAFRDEMKANGLVFGAASLPVNFRQDDAKFHDGLEKFPKQAAGLKQAGVERMGTWVTSAHDELTYEQNFQQHASRLREVAKVLKDNGLRLGLEYVGTPSSRQGRPHPFIYSMAGMRKLIAEIGTGNVGFVLDTWHWWTAGETEADLLSLKAVDVVSVDVNDAPAGIPLDKQQDGQRELPCATGVIPMAVFLNSLQRLGYDGPMRVEPFNKKLNAMSPDDACAAVMASLRKAVALLK